MKVAQVSASVQGHQGVLAVMRGIHDHLGPETSTLIVPAHPRSSVVDGILLPSKCHWASDDYFDVHLFDYATHAALQDALSHFDIVHLHSVSVLTSRTLIAILAMPKAIRPKVVFHVHTHYPAYNRARLGKTKSLVTIPIITELYRFHASLADMIVFPSDWARDELGPIFGLRQGDPRVVVWSAPVEEFSYGKQVLTIRDDVNGLLAPGTPYLSFIGRLSEEKNVAKMIRLYRWIHNVIDPRLVLVLTGSGDQAPYREIAAYEGVAKSVFFTGQVTEGGVCAISREAVAAASCCTNETEALGNLRQMRCRLPLIAPANSVLEEHIRKSDGGFAFDGTRDFLSNPEMLAINSLLADKAVNAEKGENARRYVLDYFSPERQFAALDEHYARLLAA